MRKHTPEPWSLVEAGESIKHLVPVSSDKTSILTIATEEATAFGAVYLAEDAHRIVACVNACVGMETEHLKNQAMLGENLIDRFKLLNDQVSDLGTQRDELLAALEEVTEYAEMAMEQANKAGAEWEIGYALNEARAAIANAKGGAA